MIVLLCAKAGGRRRHCESLVPRPAAGAATRDERLSPNSAFLPTLTLTSARANGCVSKGDPPGPMIYRSGLSTPAPARRCSTRADCRCRLRRTAGARANGPASAFREEGGNRPKRTAGAGPAAGVAGPGRRKAAAPPGAMPDRNGLPIPLSRPRMLNPDGPSRIPRAPRLLLGKAPFGPQAVLPQRSAATGRQGGISFIRFVPARSGRSGSPPYIAQHYHSSIYYRKKIMKCSRDRSRPGAANACRRRSD